MALGDYRTCDVCGGKAFYDANLTYEDAHDEWPRKREAVPFRVAGVEQVGDTTCLGYVGDWAVICNDCAKTHKTCIVPIDGPAQGGGTPTTGSQS